MPHYLAQRSCLRTRPLRRFAASHWTVDFPRPMMAAATTEDWGRVLVVDTQFLRANDLAGIIWWSTDTHDHPLRRYETRKDYRGLIWRFRWQSSGDIRPLDAVDGPTLTIEGRDATGAPRTWYVRLWNYATGAPGDAEITIDFDALSGGFALPGEADPVWAGDIDRLSISLVGNGFTRADVPLPASTTGQVRLTTTELDGAGAVLDVGDPFLSEHSLRIATAYDDLYNLTPIRIFDTIEALGYRGTVNHYVGMSHFMRLGWDGSRYTVAASGDPLCAPARAWHRAFLAEARLRGYTEIILSLSFELLDQHCPETWKQRDAGGSPALTGWSPPSTLLSPCNGAAMAWLQRTAQAFAELVQLVQLPVNFQVGEPWWWTGYGAERPACFYDAATTAAWTVETGLPHPERMTDARAAPDAAQRAYLDWLGTKLAQATAALVAAVRVTAPDARAHLLFYAPQVIDPSAPHLVRVNMPSAWAHPAFDVLQLEDYEFLTRGDLGAQQRARAAIDTALGYAARDQHYLAGFVLNAEDRAQWERIADGAAAAQARGVAQTFIWALPQVMRDGFTWFDVHGDEEEDVAGFHDVLFPLDIGSGAEGGPQFATHVVTTASGHEQRNIGWRSARLGYDLAPGLRSEADVATLLDFFRARRGRAFGFRFHDPADHRSADVVTAFDQLLGTGDGIQTSFAIVKHYGEDGADEQRRITRPRAESVRVGVDGVELQAGWQLLETGLVSFDIAPSAGALVTAGFVFDVPVRFDSDSLLAATGSWRHGQLGSVPIVELREA